MNTGAFGEGFPYSNFHDLNMDWIIKIAKDFLDQYTHIQETITNGEEAITAETAESIAELENKKTVLEGLLDQWYESHSYLIAHELADALRDIRELLSTSEDDFNTYAHDVASALIPPDNILLSHTWDEATHKASKYPFINGYWTEALVWHNTYDTYNACERFPVEVGDVITFNAPSAWAYNFFDANGDIAYVSFTDPHDPVDLIIANPNYKYVSITLNVTNYTNTYLEVYIENLSNRLSLSKKYNVPFLTNGYWTTSGNFRTDTTTFHATHRIPIKQGNIIEIPKLTSGYIYIFRSASEFLEVATINPSTTPEYEVTNPNAKYVSIMCNRSFYNENNIDLIIKNTREKTPIYAEIAEGVLKVKTRYRTSIDLVVEFKNKGHNNLPDFSNLYTATNARKYPFNSMDNLTTLLSIGTDWHSPFVVEALTNIDGDRVNQVDYTGGNHSYDPQDPDATPTARNTTLSYFVNDIPVSNFAGYCNNIKIIWKNRVQAYNTVKQDGTGREVLEEVHTLTFDGNEWISKVDIIPLENINMVKYYGWAISGLASIYPNYAFEGGTPRNIMTSPNTYATADHNTYIINAYGDGNRIISELDTTYDMGDRRFCENSTQIIHSQANKAYQMLVENTPMTSSYHYRARAKYKFSAN